MIFIFISLIFIFYKNNKNDFDYIYNLNLLFILKVTILSIFYLITEALIFKNITKHELEYKKIAENGNFQILQTNSLNIIIKKEIDLINLLNS